MTERFIFRQFDVRDLHLFIRDREIRAKNHSIPQLCHQTSYPEIVERRGRSIYQLPCGGVCNDYVPFYFSPLTSFAFAIARGNAKVTAPDGTDLGTSNNMNRAFFVARASDLLNSNLETCFSNLPLNSNGQVELSRNPIDLNQLVHWPVFDDTPLKAVIPEIGYSGVCRYFFDSESESYHNRKKQRMAEFLVKGAVPLNYMVCAVASTEQISDNITQLLTQAGVDIPVFLKPGCFLT